jgi:hypothetical protein
VLAAKIITALAAIAMVSPLLGAQRVYEKDNEIFYQDAQGRKTSLGRGHSPIPVSEGKILLIRGARMGYGDRFACTNPEVKNWVALYDTRTRRESVVYDKPINTKGVPPDATCIFEQADLSPSGSTLYVVTPWSATSASLAVVNLQTGHLKHVDGVNEVYVIRGGPSDGDLIYSRRLYHKLPSVAPGEDPYYPFIHAKPDGTQVGIISDEAFTVGGTAKTPILLAYLRRLQGRIYLQGDAYIQGRWLP